MSRLVNFYDKLHKDDCPEYYNPNERLEINHPFSMVIVGRTGSGKNNVLRNLIQELGDAISQIIIFCKCPDEPLYEDLAKTEKKKVACITDDISKIPTRESKIWKGHQTLVVFDDFVTDDDRTQKLISDMFIRGRKLGDNKSGASVIYITQDTCKVPTLIRNQISHLIIKGQLSHRILRKIASDCSLPFEPDEFAKVSSICNQNFDECLTVDVRNPNLDKKIRLGLYPKDVKASAKKGK